MTLSDSMFKLRWIKVIDVHNNQLEGKISSLLEMDSLTYMKIGEKNFTATIYPEIGELFQLKYF